MHPTSSRLLALPTEIRLKLYQAVFEDFTLRLNRPPKKHAGQARGPVALLLANKQIYNEALPVFHASTLFRILIAHKPSFSLGSSASHVLCQVRRLVIEVRIGTAVPRDRRRRGSSFGGLTEAPTSRRAVCRNRSIQKVVEQLEKGKGLHQLYLEYHPDSVRFAKAADVLAPLIRLRGKVGVIWIFGVGDQLARQLVSLIQIGPTNGYNDKGLSSLSGNVMKTTTGSFIVMSTDTDEEIESSSSDEDIFEMEDRQFKWKDEDEDDIIPL